MKPFIPPRRAVCILGVCVFLTLAGCASSQKAGSPSGPGQKQQDTGFFDSVLGFFGIDTSDSDGPSAHTLQLRVFTANNLNAGQDGQPMALLMKVYRLSEVKPFKQASFDDFLSTRRTKKVLGDSLIKARQMLLQPGQQYISWQTLPPKVKYLGFVALFRYPTIHRWHFVYNVSGSVKSGISLGIYACAMASSKGELLTELGLPSNSLASVHCPGEHMASA